MKNLILLITALLILNSCVKKTETSQWRGDQRTGIYQETNLLKEWPKEGPDLLWEYEGVGNGYGSPTITSDKIFVNGELDSLSHLLAFDLTGNLLWKFEYDSSWVRNFPGSRSAPTVVNDLVYVCSPMGEIVCLNTEEGTPVWSVNMLEDFNGVNTRFGFSQSLLVEGDKIYCAPGTETNVVALNRFTGETIWASKAKGEKSAFCSPLLIELPTRNILVTFSEFSLFGLDTQSGELLWVHDQDTLCDIHGNTPLYENGFIYYTAGCGNGTVKLQLSEDGSKITEVWRTLDLDNIQGGLIKIGNKLYGAGQRKLLLKALDANTGEFIDSLDVKRGVTIYADGLFYYYAEQGGFMNLINPEPKLKLISKFQITKGTKEHFAHPVIKNGVLYVRHGNVLLAYDIRKREE